VLGRGEVSEAVYTFKHALVQEVAYASLLRERRRQLHARIAQVLEGAFPEVAETQCATTRRCFLMGPRPFAIRNVAWDTACDYVEFNSDFPGQPFRIDSGRGVAGAAIRPDG
jgi:hypothetical protein